MGLMLVAGLATSASTLATHLAAAADTSPGCGTTSPGSTTLHFRVGGRERQVLVHVGRRLDPSSAHALVLNLHGTASTAAEAAGFTGMNKAANADGFIVAYPQGVIPFDGGFAWNVPNEPIFGGIAVPKGSPNDVTYLVAVVKAVERQYCVDPQQVYATGFSGGAREVSQLACDASSVFAAVAPVSGLRWPTPCPTTRAVPVLSFHGSADPVDPFDGHGQPYWSYSVSTAAKDWARQDHCDTLATTSTPVADVTLSDYAHCANGASVELYEVVGEGHEWPGGPTLPAAFTKFAGPQSNAINANAIMWAFFSAHPLTTP